MKLKEDFYSRDTLYVAENLLGKVLVRKKDEEVFKGIIVETEAYLGIKDKASHSYNNRRTKRTETMYKKAGTIYIFFIYGIHYLLNIVTREIEIPEAVLIRAVEPISSLDKIALNRYNKLYNDLSIYQKNNMTNGPGKLTKAFDIDYRFDGLDLFGENIYIEDLNYKDFEIIKDKRIGIDYSEEAVDYKYRFFIKNNRYVSKRGGWLWKYYIEN